VEGRGGKKRRRDKDYKEIYGKIIIIKIIKIHQ